MCTVIFDWYPGSKTPLIVGANRDERAERPSTHFDYRNDGEALYPLDFRGGSWIAVNRHGVFAAITNCDGFPHSHGKESRGALVTKAVESKTVADVAKWADKLEGKRFNAFNLILADKKSCIIYGCDGSQVKPRVLAPGRHIVTGFGVNTWDVSRCKTIAFNLERGKNLRDVMSTHVSGLMEDDVCVHDLEETHVTVSSCVIQANRSWKFTVEAVDCAPCQAKAWETWAF